MIISRTYYIRAGRVDKDTILWIHELEVNSLEAAIEQRNILHHYPVVQLLEVTSWRFEEGIVRMEIDLQDPSKGIVWRMPGINGDWESCPEQEMMAEMIFPATRYKPLTLEV